MLFVNEFALFYILYHKDLPTQPPATPLSLECTAEFNSMTQEICLTCTSSRNLASLNFACSVNGQLVTDGCEFFRFVIPKLHISVQLNSHMYACFFLQVENSRSACLLLDSPRDYR